MDRELLRNYRHFCRRLRRSFTDEYELIQTRHIGAFAIEVGANEVEYQASPSTGGFVYVQFANPFPRPPKVFAQDRLANGSASAVTVSEITNTGFRLLARTTSNSSAGRTEINWMAILVN